MAEWIKWKEDEKTETWPALVQGAKEHRKATNQVQFKKQTFGKNSSKLEQKLEQACYSTGVFFPTGAEAVN